jgi:hypothetical protein
MSVYQHPHLTRGIVKTPKGAFVVSRGLVEVPDEIGEAMGWRTVDEQSDRSAAAGLSAELAETHTERRSRQS